MTNICIFNMQHIWQICMGYIMYAYICVDFPGGSPVKNTLANAGDLSLIPGSGRFSEEGNGNPLQYSCLENHMDRGAWWATVHEVTKSWTWLSEWTTMMMCVCVCVYIKKNIKVPWLLRTAGLVLCVHVFSNTWLRKCIGIVVAELLSRVQLFATPWIVAHQAPLSIELSWQASWSGLPLASLLKPIEKYPFFIFVASGVCWQPLVFLALDMRHSDLDLCHPYVSFIPFIIRTPVILV